MAFAQLEMVRGENCIQARNLISAKIGNVEEARESIGIIHRVLEDKRSRDEN
jgi:hypothetical protein